MLAVVFVLFYLLPSGGLAQQIFQTSAPPHYVVVDLGTLGGSFAQPGGINEKGDIEGYSLLSGDTQLQAYFWHHGKFTLIPGLGGPNSFAGWAPSETGQVGVSGDIAELDPIAEDFCGIGSMFYCHPYVWQHGQITPLPLLHGNNAAANGFNNKDQVVGKAEQAIADPSCQPPRVHASQGVIWQHGKLTTVLANFPGDLQGSGHSINDFGQVVGWSGSCSEFVSHALLWDHGRRFDLGSLKGGDSNIAYDINNLGQVVGYSGNSDQSFAHAYLWKSGHMQDLGTLPGDSFSLAVGLNDVGDVVGGSIDLDGNERAFLWHDGTMFDLNTLLDTDTSLFLFEAEDLNSAGQIIGLAFDPESGETHGFLANPVGSNGGFATQNSRFHPPDFPDTFRKHVRERLKNRRFARFH